MLKETKKVYPPAIEKFLKDSIESVDACDLELIGNIVDDEVIDAFCKVRKIPSPQYVLPKCDKEKALSEAVDVLLVMLNFTPRKVTKMTISRLAELACIPSSTRNMSMKEGFTTSKKNKEEIKSDTLRDKVFDWLRFTDHNVDNMTDANVRFLAKSAGLTIPIGKLKDESIREKITNETLEWSRRA